MIQNGFAWHYKRYSSDPVMAKSEVEARTAKIGLWEMKNPTAPWNYRKFKKEYSKGF